MAKRAFDLLCAFVGLVALSPLLTIVALAIVLDDRGPPLFRQWRVGRRGAQFRVCKFRTMRASTDVTERRITVGDDARITRIGRFLRRTKIDELPQLWNVLTGDMSIVGPRPEVPHFVAMYPEPVRSLILSLRPGITDAASIRFVNESTLLGNAMDPERFYADVILPEKLLMYEEYVRQRSFVGDIRIVLRTIGTILKVA